MVLKCMLLIEMIEKFINGHFQQVLMSVHQVLQEHLILIEMMMREVLSLSQMVQKCILLPIQIIEQISTH